MKLKDESNASEDQSTDQVEENQRSESENVSIEANKGMTRRLFLASGAGAAAALVSPGVINAQSKRKRGAARNARHPQPRAVSPTSYIDFREPPAVYARTMPDGQSALKAELNCEMTAWEYVCDGQVFKGAIPIYNRSVPAPTFFVDPATRIELRLNNRLPPKWSPTGSDVCGQHGGDPPPPQCFTHTNLHTHGLLVSPCSIDNNLKLHCGPIRANELRLASDDVLVDLYPSDPTTGYPGDSLRYCITLPEFHDAGTFWYHSHLHGSSGYQVSSGMAGALIIREPPGEEIVQQDRDKIWLMQEVVFGGDGTLPAVYGSPGDAPETRFLINGLCRPTLRMETGQTQRWRFINATATPRGLMKLRLVKCPNNVCDNTIPPQSPSDIVMNLIAVDGISFYGFPPQKVRAHLVAPGNRADFLINISQPGMYKLIKDAFPIDATTSGPLPNNQYTRASLGSTQVLAFIEVAPSPSNEKIPDLVPGRRPEYLLPICRVDRVRPQPITFQNPDAQKFQIDNMYYMPDNPAIEVNLNTCEEWTLQNTASAKVPQSNAHPFHIHVNPFQIVGRTIDFEVLNQDLPPSGRLRNEPANWIWSDTAALPGQNPPGTGPVGQLKIRSRFLVYPGEFVFHCHILVHEDIGMMMNVKIKGDGVGPCAPLKEIPPPARQCIDRTKC
jgi:FtsP/CotA-like multicopper oxidase with cupredoxin domain